MGSRVCPAAQQRLIEQLQRQLAGQGGAPTDTTSNADAGVDVEAATAVARAAAAKVGELQQQLEQARKQNKQLVRSVDTLKAKGA